MGLVGYYKRQFAWRSWPALLDALPPLAGRTVLDVGCSVGDLAAELAARGAQVIGLDTNEETLEYARSRDIAGADFRTVDLRALPDLGLAADGLWSSFVAAYFPDFTPALAAWGDYVKPGGWIALTEIDDMLGHEPLSARSKGLFSAYVEEALASGRYDFNMGRKLASYLGAGGWTIMKTMTVEDKELSFSGPAGPGVVEAWRERFDVMSLLQERCGRSWDEVREEFLACLARPEHVSTASVRCCIARKPR